MQIKFLFITDGLKRIDNIDTSKNIPTSNAVDTAIKEYILKTVKYMQNNNSETFTIEDNAVYLLCVNLAYFGSNVYILNSSNGSPNVVTQIFNNTNRISVSINDYVVTITKNNTNGCRMTLYRLSLY